MCLRANFIQFWEFLVFVLWLVVAAIMGFLDLLCTYHTNLRRYDFTPFDISVAVRGNVSSTLS